MTHFTSANIGRASRARRFLAILHVVARVTRATISAWCELQSDERKHATKLRPDATWVGASTACPLQIGPAWKILDQKITRIFPGKPKYAGPLHLVEVTVRRKWRPWSRPVHIMSTHLVALFGRYKTLYEHEQSVEWGQLRGAVADARGRGLDVVILGDFNIENNAPIPRAHRDQVVAYRSGLDAVLAIPAPGRQAVVAKGSTFVLGVEPQHKGIDVRVTFPKAA
jgi:hypothetical protein